MTRSLPANRQSPRSLVFAPTSEQRSSHGPWAFPVDHANLRAIERRISAEEIEEAEIEPVGLQIKRALLAYGH